MNALEFIVILERAMLDKNSKSVGRTFRPTGKVVVVGMLFGSTVLPAVYCSAAATASPRQIHFRNAPATQPNFQPFDLDRSKLFIVFWGALTLVVSVLVDMLNTASVEGR